MVSLAYIWHPLGLHRLVEGKDGRVPMVCRGGECTVGETLASLNCQSSADTAINAEDTSSVTEKVSAKYSGCDSYG